MGSITNIPPDTSLREAYLVFSLCIDEVTYVDIVNERLSAGGQRSNDDVQRGAADTANGAPAIEFAFVGGLVQISNKKQIHIL